MSVRLPTNVIPVHYHLNYERVDLKTFDFLGFVEIDILVKEKTGVKEIKLHSVNLKISEATVQQKEKKFSSSSINFDIPSQTVTFVFNESIPEGESKLKISFQGVLNEKLDGFYRSTYKNENGEQRVMAVTQFEPVDARKAFPCWDEPNLKASFQVTVTTQADRIVVSNTPVTQTTVTPDQSYECGRKQTWNFAKTPIMSTYLLAIVISEFDMISDFTKTGIQVRVFTPLGKSEQGRFSLNVAVKSLEYYEEIFGIKYPITKSDLLAIPDFAAGAMENWGCVTYREARVLASPLTSSASLVAMARVVCHELAHQWFGNLVTMEWWTHLWLNEGFARFMEFVAVHHIFPEWNSWNDFVFSVSSLALRLDAMKSSHPVEVPVNHPDEINEIFDTISYAKGASIIRMLANYIGIDSFMKGLHIYLTKFAYKNAVTEDLWNSIKESSGKDIESIMKNWTSKMGYPLISINDNSDKSVSFSQKRYFSSNSSDSVNDDDTKWVIPLNVVTEGGVSDRTFLIGSTNESEEKQFAEYIQKLENEGKWFKLNSQQTSFCRVNYTSNQWSRLSNLLKTDHNNLHVADRIGLLSDCFSLASSGHLLTVQALELCQSLKNESEYFVWAEICSNLKELCRLYSEQSFFPKFQKFVQDTCLPIATKLGWDAKEGENSDFMKLRASLISVLSAAGHQETIQEGINRFDKHITDSSYSLSPDLRTQIFLIAARNKGQGVWEELVNIYRTTTESEIQRQVLMAIGAVNGKAENALQFMLDEVRSQDASFPLAGVCSSIKGASTAWTFFTSKYEEFEKRFKGLFLWSSIIGAIVDGIQSHEQVEQIKAFFKDHDAASATRKVQQGIESVNNKLAQLSRDVSSVTNFLEK